MQDLPSLEIIKTWPQLAPGLYWRTLPLPSSSLVHLPARAQLSLHYKAYLVGAEGKLNKVDGTLDGDFASISADNVPLSVVIGSKSTIPAWEIMFTPTESHSEVHVGDMIEFLASSDLCYGAGGRCVPLHLMSTFSEFKANS